MRHPDAHPTDRELLAALDAELTAREQADVEAHLGRCHGCRTRFAAMRHAASAIETALDARADRAPDLQAARTRLVARLDRLAAEPVPRRTFVCRLPPRHTLAAVAAVAAVAVVAWLPLLTGWLSPLDRTSRLGPLPAASVTPGVTWEVSAAELCAGARNTQPISDDMKREVLAAYGMERMPADQYELDYLITPELGGATHARNLWPQPYGSRIWNARVKDALERLLPEMVCSGRLDLKTAQHAMAVDWIAAYKKYFQTDRPLAAHRDLEDDDDRVSVYALN
jgi:anti-sigma factor RsiW